jgi:hypothetical protein
MSHLKMKILRKKKDNPNNFTGDLSNHFVPHILFDINGCRRIAIIKLEDIYETETYFSIF